MKKVHRILRGIVLFLGFVAAGLVGWHLSRRQMVSGGSQPLPLADYGMVNGFSLTERSGKKITLADLSGAPWVADFIFTRCMGPCPAMSFQMSKLQDAFLQNTDLRFVSFSVDPAYDTPDVLTKYAATYKADPARWLFLTGETAKVYDLILKSFRLAVEKNIDPKQKPGEQVNHSLFFVLVDRDAHIKGYYNATEIEAMARLKNDIKKL